MARARTAWREDDWVEAAPPPRPGQPSRRSSRGPSRRSRRGSGRPRGGVWRALGLTFASTLVWGVAHVSVGRRLAGVSLMALLGVLVAGAATLAVGIPAGYARHLAPIAVERVWLNGITAGILV